VLHNAPSTQKFDDSILRRLESLAAMHPWPALSRALPTDIVYRRREQQSLLTSIRLIERVLDEERWLIMHWRATRGFVTRALATAVWKSTVIAVGHWSDVMSTNYFPGCLRMEASAAAWFFSDCASYSRRIIPLIESYVNKVHASAA
jgi:hypothetical protein